MFEFLKHVDAIRIYYSGRTTMADLKNSDGVIETIEWLDPKQRKPFEQYIDGTTLIFDERTKNKKF